MNKFLLLLTLFSLQSFAINTQKIEDSLLGGTLTNRTTKQRLGVICSKTDESNIGGKTLTLCSQFKVVLINGKNEVESLSVVSTIDSSNDIKRSTQKLNTYYDSDIYSNLSVYYNYPAYFYGLTAANSFECAHNDIWWCLLIPFTAIIDTVATTGYHVGSSVWEVAIAGSNLVDNIAGKANKRSQVKTISKNLVHILNNKKIGKNKNISAEKFNLLIQIL